MGREVLSEKAYRRVADTARAAGSATHRGEQRHREGKGLHELVDPAGYGVIRRSISWKEPRGDQFELLRGAAMLVETRLDTTGSMGSNVEVAMNVLPTTYKLLATGNNAVLSRYDTQMITAIFGDVTDKYVLQRSQAEMDERIAEQMTCMMPERAGGDMPEDPQYGLFGAAYLTDAEITKYGLRYYDFTLSDAPGRNRLSAEKLVRVFGNSVFEKVADAGFQINRHKLPETGEIVVDLLKRAHAFFLQVGDSRETSEFWAPIYGRNRVVKVKTVDLLPYYEAVIIGLTEGTLDLQSAPDFLRSDGLDQTQASEIVRAVSHIPLGAQASLHGFNQVPLRGAMFASKDDLWPIKESENKPAATKPVSKIKWK